MCPHLKTAAIVHKEVTTALKNEHNKVVWLRSLDIHAFPIFGKKSVDTVESADVLRATGSSPRMVPHKARQTEPMLRQRPQGRRPQLQFSVQNRNFTANWICRDVPTIEVICPALERFPV
jgi:hypothetical protein